MMALKKVERIRSKAQLPHVDVYFPSPERLEHFKAIIREDFEAGLLTTKHMSTFLYSLLCRYDRERKQGSEGEARR